MEEKMSNQKRKDTGRCTTPITTAPEGKWPNRLDTFCASVVTASRGSAEAAEDSPGWLKKNSELWSRNLPSKDP